MKKYLCFIFIFAFAIGLFVSYKPSVYAASSDNFQVFEAGEHDISIDLQLGVGSGVYPPVSYTSSSPVYWVKTYTLSSGRPFRRQDYIISNSSFTLRFNINGTISSYSSSRLVSPTGNFYYYRITNTNTFPSGSSTYGFLVSSETIKGSSNTPAGSTDTSFDEFIDHVISGMFPDDLGGINNPIKNQTIGALNNVYEKSNYQIRQINFQVGNFGVNPNLTKDYYFNFGWDTKTNTNVNLSQYSIKFAYAGIVNNGLTSQVINYTEVVPFNLTYNHSIMFTDLLKKSGIVPDTTYDEDLPIAWTWSDLTVLLQPILIDSQGRYNIGDYTQVKFSYTGDTGSVITENLDINSDPTEGLRPSPNQNGTGINYDPISKFNETTGKDVNPSSVDFSGVKSVLYDLQSTVTEVPLIFGKLMSFLPSWLISLIIASIGLMVAVGLFKFMLEVIT